MTSCKRYFYPLGVNLDLPMVWTYGVKAVEVDRYLDIVSPRVAHHGITGKVEP